MFGEQKRTFKELQLLVLRALRAKESTIYQIAKRAGIDFRTASHQLILLRGNGFAELVFELDHIRVFTITAEGLSYLRKLERCKK